MKKTIVPLLILLALALSSCSDSDTKSNYTTAQNLLNDVGFNGYAIITKNGNDLVRDGFGLANKTTGLTQGTTLNYRIGSVSKTLTAAAIMQLKRDGLINNLEQTLNEFDSEFPHGNTINLKQLLSHQSGIPEYQLIVEQAYSQGEELSPEDTYELVTDLIKENGLNFTPGEYKEYTNSNYLIAALLVEKLSGISYHDYVKQYILTPLQMSNTYKGNNSINPNTHAEGYLNNTANSTYPMSIPFGAGDFSSTPTDMEKWTNAVKNNWFNETEQEEIFVQNVPSGFVDLGLGWFTTQESNTTMYWHGGDINGYWSMIGFIPKHNAAIVLLSNEQGNTRSTQRNTIIEALLKNEFN